MMNMKKLMRFKKKLLIAIACLLLSLGTLIVAWALMPQPNAYDFYLKASNAIVDREKVSRYASPTEREAVVNRNTEALRILRQGFAYSYHQPPKQPFMTASPSPHFPDFRQLALLLLFEGEIKSAKGDQRGALSSYLDAIQVTSDVPKGRSIIALITGFYLEEWARLPIWKVLNTVDAGSAQAAARRLEAIESRRVSFADVLRGEKATGLASLLQDFRSGHFKQLKELADYKDEQQLVRDYHAMMDSLINTAQLPYSDRQPLLKNPVSQAIGFAYESARFGNLKNRTQSALLTVALGLRAAKEERGAYPSSVQELTPIYLAKVPDDPFAPETALRYMQQGKAYVLYSVGPDGRDDGGKAIENQNKPPSERYIVEGSSRGDIVAGVNF